MEKREEGDDIGDALTGAGLVDDGSAEETAAAGERAVAYTWRSCNAVATRLIPGAVATRLRRGCHAAYTLRGCNVARRVLWRVTAATA
jgi:hypothetical protein